MGLANQPGNQVTLSYRQERFSRIKDRNQKRIDDCIRSGKIQALFNSMPVEFKSESVIIDVKGAQQEISNDFVWIFAGGTPPFDFLKKIGVGFGMCDQTQEAGKEARQAATELRPVSRSHDSLRRRSSSSCDKSNFNRGFANNGILFKASISSFVWQALALVNMISSLHENCGSDADQRRK